MLENRHLKCPACESNLTSFEAGAVVVDVCNNGCGGIWFDKNELYKVDNKQELDGAVLLNIRKNPNVVAVEKERFCPICQTQRMRKHYYSPKLQTFEIDECDKCGGIWLDNKEIDAIRTTFENDKDKFSYEGNYMSALSFELLDMIEEEKRAKEENFRRIPLMDKIFYLVFGV